MNAPRKKRGAKPTKKHRKYYRNRVGRKAGAISFYMQRKLQRGT